MGIPENIKSLRERSNMTQKKLAEKSGLSIASIQGYEQGKFEPKKEALYKLVKALECNIYEIIDSPYDLPDLSNENLEDIGNGIMITSNCPPDIREKIKASFSDDYDTSKGSPRISVPMSNDTIWVDADPDTPLNKALQKERNGEELTEEESKLISDYFGSEQFKNAWEHMKNSANENLKDLKRLQIAYEQLNDIGQDKVAEHAEMLAKIPEYRKEGYQEKTDK